MKKGWVAFFCFSLLLTACGDNSTQETTQEDNMETVPSSTPETTENTSTDDNTNTTDAINAPDVVYGIDISKYQGDEIDVLDKAKDDLNFVICKGTEGITYTDPDYSRNWQEIEEKGFIRGVYHFYRSADDPEQQADNFLSILGDLEVTDFAPIIDVEEGGIDEGQSIEKVQQDLVSFLNIIEEKTERMPIIYTNPSVGNKYFSNNKFAKYPLWIADYSGEDAPRMPGIWSDKEWELWQKADDYVIDDMKNDYDAFNGSLEKLEEFIRAY